MPKKQSENGNTNSSNSMDYYDSMAAPPINGPHGEITIESIFDTRPRLAIGALCLVQQTAKGIVKYWGPVPELGDGDWVGVDLENPVGDSDGSISGHVYFEAKPNHAIFVSPSVVTPYDEDLTSAAIIDDVKKKLEAKELERRQANSENWNKLDNYQEQMLLRRALVLENIFGTSTRRVNIDQMEPIEVESNYQGPHLHFPMTVDSVMLMLEHFKRGSVLHIKYALDLLAHTRKIFSGEPTLQEITIQDDHKLTIVGDIHGQLQDLFTIFTLNGLPSEESEYLFNGDLVDRGQNGAEVLFTVLAFKCLFPKQIRVNRGNHECRQQNRIMGFEEEILTKYPGPNGRVLLAACQKVFDCMPLCGLIHNKIFVVHGGLFSQEGVLLDHIRGISRKREPPIHSSVFEDKLFEEMLWSDPRPIVGRQTSMRGAGVEFGQDVTFDFLRTNQLALVVRSHECVNEGYELIHNGRLMTLFSASRYCGMQTNKGAFLSMRNDLQPEIQQYYAHAIKDSHWSKPTISMSEQEEMARALEEDMIKMIIVSLLDHKPSLYWYFTQVDKEKSGFVGIEEWSTGLKTVLQLDLPFPALAKRLSELEQDGRICYGKFLDRYRIEMTGAAANWQDAVIDSICEKLFFALKGKSTSVRDAFSVFDVDNDGKIEYEEFINTLKTMDVGLSEAQIYELMRGMDQNKDSVIDLEEFTNRFGVIFTGYVDRELEKSRGLSDVDIHMLNQVGEMVLKSRRQLQKVFAEIDEHNTGEITYDQFKIFVHKLGLGPKTNDDQIRRIAEHVDLDHNGLINYQEFSKAFKVTDVKDMKRRQSHGDGSKLPLASGSGVEDESAGWADRIIQQMSNFLFQYRLELASMFRAFDVNNDGTISRQEFKDGFVKLNKVFNMMLTEEQIEHLMKAIDRNGDGELSYNEFLNAFKIVDTGLKK